MVLAWVDQRWNTNRLSVDHSYDSEMCSMGTLRLKIMVVDAANVNPLSTAADGTVE